MTLLDRFGVKALAKELPTAPPERRRQIAETLCTLCRENNGIASAVNPLLSCLEDEDEPTGDSASWGLKYCAPRSIEPLIECLRHLDAKVRRRAAQALGNIGDEARAACDALREHLRDPAPEVRQKAAWALGLIHDTAIRSVDLLYEMAQSELAPDRSAALHALGNIGRTLEVPLPLRAHRQVIEAAVDDVDGDVRWSALYAHEGLREERAASIDFLCHRLAVDDSSRVQQSIAHRLKTLGPGADLVEHVPLLARIVASGGLGGWDVCELLAAMGSDAAAAVPALVEEVNGGETGVTIRAAIALWSITKDAKLVLPCLERLLDSHDEEVCDAIATIGRPATPLLAPLIAKISCTDDWDFQWAATDAVGALAENNADALPALLSALSHDSPIVRGSAVRGLARVGLPAVPALIERLACREGSLAEWAAETLGQIGTVAADAAPALRLAMARGPRGLAFWSAVALARMCADQSAAALLIAVFDDDADPYLRKSAVTALGALHPNTRGLSAALKRATRDDDESVRAEAIEVLSRHDAGMH
jgi:HEAT repeat protein